MNPVASAQDLSVQIAQKNLVLVYFLGGTCTACWAIQRELERILAEFPQVKALVVHCEKQPDLAAAYNVFAVPVTLLFVQGKESLRLGRHLDFSEFRRKLLRYCSLLDAETT